MMQILLTQDDTSDHSMNTEKVLADAKTNWLVCEI